MPGAPEKVCVICGQDCAGKPRVKDPQGRYSCKSCHEAATVRKAPAAQAPGPGVAKTKATSAPLAAAVATRPQTKPAPAPEPEPDPVFDGLDNASLLEGIESSASTPPAAESCGGCGMPLSPGAMVCMSCGYNRMTGRAGKVKVSKEGGGTAGAVAGAAAKVLWQANPLAWALGGAIGGAIGAAVWAFVSYQFHFEISYIAVGVGILTGIGVAAVARDNASEFSGVIAAIIAVIAVAGGKYASVSFQLRDLPEEVATFQASDDDALVRIATDVADDYESKGHRLNWPRGMDNENAVKREDFPRDIWDEASKKWRAMKPAERDQFKQTMQDEFKAFIGTLDTADIEEAAFMSSFSLFDVLWFGLAVCAAFGAGSGYGFGSDD